VNQTGAVAASVCFREQRDAQLVEMGSKVAWPIASVLGAVSSAPGWKRERRPDLNPSRISRVYWELRCNRDLFRPISETGVIDLC
jgi:hypothetical protein